MSFLRMKKCEWSANVLLHFRCAKEKCIKYETNAVWTWKHTVRTVGQIVHKSSEYFGMTENGTSFHLIRCCNYNFMQVNAVNCLPVPLCMASASESALIMNNHKNSINYVPTVASCLTPPMANSIASLGRGKGVRGEASTVGAELNGMQKCKSKIIYASLLTAVAAALRRIASACCGHKNLAQLSPLSPFGHSPLYVCLSVSFCIAFRIALCFCARTRP